MSATRAGTSRWAYSNLGESISIIWLLESKDNKLNQDEISMALLTSNWLDRLSENIQLTISLNLWA